MTVKYQRARVRVEAGGLERWDERMPIEIRDRPDRGELICLGCSALMSWTQAFLNKHHTEVPAYFRLLRGAEHEPDCRLNFRTIMEGIRRGPESRVDLRDMKYFLRLPGESLTPNIQKTSTTVSKRSDALAWAQTFSSAKKIAEFLRQFDDADEFLNQLKVDYKDAKGNPYEMFWRDFCFDAADPIATARHYRRLRDSAPGAAVHPIAVTATVRGTPKTTNSGAEQYIRISTGATVTSKTGAKRELAVAIYSSTLLTDIKDGDTVLALEHARIWDHDHDAVTELQLRLIHPWQLTRIAVAGRV
jgi:hypothetical protein